MEKKGRHLGVLPQEGDFRLLAADRLLTTMADEKRMEFFKETFLEAAKNHNDEAACALIGEIGKEYYFKGRKIADETDKHYGNADIRANADFCEYLKSIYWELPDRMKTGKDRRIFYPYEPYPVYGPTLIKTKIQIIKVCIGRWAGYSYGRKYFEEVDEQSLGIFNFLLDAYFGVPGTHYVFTEEREEILKLFREVTDSYFTPEITEKWLRQPNVPEEIQKIFIIARARNGGMELVKRDMENAEIIKSFDLGNLSNAALDFGKKFCGELREVDAKIRRLLKELEEISLGEAEKIEFEYFDLREIVLHVRFKKDRLPYHSLSWDSRILQLGQDIRRLFCSAKYRAGHHMKITFIFWEEECNWGNYHDTVYLGG